MRRGRPKAPLTLSDEERETLERWARRPTTAQALAQRARIVLACVGGRDNSVVAVEDARDAPDGRPLASPVRGEARGRAAR